MKPLKATLLVGGIYAASVFACLALLVAGAIAAGGSGASRAETVLLGVLGVSALCLAMGTALVYWVLGRAGLAGAARVLALLSYGLVACATLLVLFFVGAVVFNR